MGEPNLRVLMVCRALPCHVRGGLEFHALDLARGLVDRGVAVDLLSAQVPTAYQSELKGLGLGIHSFEGVEPGRYTVPWMRRVGPEIDRITAEGRYDVIHGQEFALGLWRPPADARTRVVMTVHGTLTTETPLHRDVFRELSWAGRARAVVRFGRRFSFARPWRRTLSAASAILVDSEFTERELVRFAPRTHPRVRRVPLGVDMSRYPEVDAASARRDLGWSGGDLRIVTLGRLEWQKGHILALGALAKIKNLPWRYVIIGEGEARASLESVARGLRIEPQVEFAGRVDDDLKARMLAGADLFLWPERTHPAFGLVGLEAQLMGSPVLASRRGAIPEVVDPEQGWLFEPVTAEGMYPKLRYLLANPGLLTQARKNLRQRTLVRFQPEAMIEATLAVYREVTGRE